MTHYDDLRAPKSVQGLLRARAQHEPTRVAYSFLADDGVGVTDLTYSELDERARSVAVGLLAAGAKGRRVVLLLPAGAAFVTGLMGCLYAGATAVPAPAPQRGQAQERIQRIICDADATLILAAEAANVQGLLGLEPPPGRPGLKLLSLQDFPLADASVFRESDELDAGIPAVLQYTSGSTGTPKGVVVTHAAVMANGRAIARTFGHHSAYSRGVVWLPPFHDMGLVGGILQPLQVGFPCLLMTPSAFLRRPRRWLEAITNYQATTSGGPTFAYELSAQQIRPEECERLDLRSWDVAFCGAEPVRAEALERFARRFASVGFSPKAFLPCYGLAEACLIVSGATKGTGLNPKAWNAEFLGQRCALLDCDGKTLVSSGVPVEETQVLVVDPDRQVPVPDRAVGEIWVSGPGIAAGYWRRPEESETTFGAAVPGDSRRFLRTGDLGFLHEGELFVTGRAKELVVCNGRNLYPDDLERTALRLQSSNRRSLKVHAFAVEEADAEYLIVVHEVDGSCADHMRLMQAIRAALSAEHGVDLHEIVLVPRGTLSVTSSGKPQRSRTRALYVEQRLPVKARFKPSAAERAGRACAALDVLDPGSIEQWIVDELVKRLGVDASEVDPRQPFSRLGLDSVRALELLTDLEQATGHGLTPETLYEQPSIRALARHISRATTGLRSARTLVEHGIAGGRGL